jgi:hypothetical protein
MLFPLVRARSIRAVRPEEPRCQPRPAHSRAARNSPVSPAMDQILERSKHTGKRPTIADVERRLGIARATFCRRFTALTDTYFKSRAAELRKSSVSSYPHCCLATRARPTSSGWSTTATSPPPTDPSTRDGKRAGSLLRARMRRSCRDLQVHVSCGWRGPGNRRVRPADEAERHAP